MAQKISLARLQDITTNIGNIESYLQGRSLADFQNDNMLRQAVERAIEIISEASRHLPDEAKARFPLIPWHEIKAIGNILRHEYQRVDAEAVWQTATMDLDSLRLAVETMRQEIITVRKT
jgi:uncharacterized protein with HEPN domain